MTVAPPTRELNDTGCCGGNGGADGIELLGPRGSLSSVDDVAAAAAAGVEEGNTNDEAADDECSVTVVLVVVAAAVAVCSGDTSHSMVVCQ